MYFEWKSVYDICHYIIDTFYSWWTIDNYLSNIISSSSPGTGRQINRKIIHLCNITVDMNRFNRWSHTYIVKNRSRSNYFARECCVCVFFFFIARRKTLSKERQSHSHLEWETRLLFSRINFHAIAITLLLKKKKNKNNTFCIDAVSCIDGNIRESYNEVLLIRV